MSYIAKPWTFLEADSHEEEWNRCRPLTIADADDNDLAIIFSNEDSTVGQSRADAVAAAKLIAAAPELYTALAELVDVIQTDGVSRIAYADLIEQAKQVIRQAV